MAGLKMIVELRPCLVKGKKHLFHCWDHRAWTVGGECLKGRPFWWTVLHGPGCSGGRIWPGA